MKKLATLVLVVLLSVSFYGCRKADNSSSNFSSAILQLDAETFKKPDNYASAVKTKLSGEFVFYLNSENAVIAIEPLDENAKTILKDATIKNGGLDSVLANITDISKEKGLFEEGKTVEVEVLETKDSTIDSEAVLNSVTQSANKAIGVEDTTSTQTSTPTTSNTPTIQHTHKYFEATCTEPEKCSCGSIKGDALGHSYGEWKDEKAATYDAKGISARTCARCGEKQTKEIARLKKNLVGGIFQIKDPAQDKITILEITVWDETQKDFQEMDLLWSVKIYEELDTLYDAGFFFNNPDFIVYEGNGRRYPTKEEALQRAKELEYYDVIYENSISYVSTGGDGEPIENVTITNDSFSIDHEGKSHNITFNYDGYETLTITGNSKCQSQWSCIFGENTYIDIKKGTVLTRTN